LTKVDGFRLEKNYTQTCLKESEEENQAGLLANHGSSKKLPLEKANSLNRSLKVTYSTHPAFFIIMQQFYFK